MAAREQLHALVDSLPEGALESAQTYLKAIQTWPHKRPEQRPEVEKFRKELEQKRDKFLKLSGSGTRIDAWAVDRNNKTHASCGSTDHNWETGEMTIRTFRVHHDFPLEITERFRMKDADNTLEYDFHISGLGNEHGFVLQFKADGS
jgi:lysozyme family protein